MKTKILILFLFLAFASSAIAGEPFWEYLYNPESGYIWGATVDKDNKIYIASNNGVFVSSDYGKSWIDILLGKSISKINVSNRNCIIVQNSIPGDNYFFSSINSGKTWNKLNSLLEISKKSPYLGGVDSSGNFYIWFYNDSLKQYLYSKDNGNSWVKKNIIIDGFNDKMYMVSFGVTSNDILFLSALSFDSLQNKYEILCVSKDRGISWKYIKIQNPLMGYKVIDFNSFIYQFNRRFYYTSDFGKNWEISPFASFDLSPIYFTKENEIFTSSIEDLSLYYSSDFGKNWENRSVGYEKTSLYSFTQDSSMNVYFFGINHGIYSSKNKGLSWQRSSKGFTSADVKRMVFDKKGNIYIVGNGIFKSEDNGTTWKNLGFEGWHLSTIAINDKGDLFSSIYFGRFFRSTNDGLTWDTITKGIPYNIEFDNLLINKRGYILGSTPFTSVVIHKKPYYKYNMDRKSKQMA